VVIIYTVLFGGPSALHPQPLVDLVFYAKTYHGIGKKVIVSEQRIPRLYDLAVIGRHRGRGISPGFTVDYFYDYVEGGQELA